MARQTKALIFLVWFLLSILSLFLLSSFDLSHAELNIVMIIGQMFFGFGLVIMIQQIKAKNKLLAIVFSFLLVYIGFMMLFIGGINRFIDLIYSNINSSLFCYWIIKNGPVGDNLLKWLLPQFCLLFIILGIGLNFSALISYFVLKNKCTKKLSVTCVDVNIKYKYVRDGNSDSRQVKIYKPRWLGVYKQKEYIFERNIYVSKSYNINDTEIIFINPDNLNEFIDSSYKSDLYISTILGSMFFIIGFILLILVLMFVF